MSTISALVPDRLRRLWEEVAAERMTAEAFERERLRLLGDYRGRWERALVESGQTDLRDSLLAEMAAYERDLDVQEIDRRCSTAVATLRHEWQQSVDPASRASIEQFYQSPTTLYELLDWHSLRDDDGPLAYVLALDIAREREVESCLDFGSGVGSGALLFRQAGIQMTLADISTPLLTFCRWRFDRRRQTAGFVDLKRDPLPRETFDMILAMDVFEHLADPVDAVEQLSVALRPGGLLFARIHGEEDADRPQHIVRDFEPTLRRMAALGLVETWRDGWIWGHQLFRKTPSGAPRGTQPS